MTRSKAQVKEAIKLDAGNRAIRTFVTGLLIDVVVGIALAVGAAFASAEGWGDIQWVILSFSVAKSVVQSVVSYLMRRFVDQSRIPTPTPPKISGA